MPQFRLEHAAVLDQLQLKKLLLRSLPSLRLLLIPVSLLRSRKRERVERILRMNQEVSPRTLNSGAYMSYLLPLLSGGIFFFNFLLDQQGPLSHLPP